MKGEAKELIDEAKALHSDFFGVPATAAAVAPGRVEVLGNHTDYNDGFVLSAAIDRFTVQVGALRDESFGESLEFEVYSKAMNGSKVKFSLESDERFEGKQQWANYVKGPLLALKERGLRVTPFTAVIAGDLPLGSGMSSSAALGLSTVLLAGQLCGFSLSKGDLARLVQKAENEFVGVKCGILDQTSSAFGREDSLLFLDCRALGRGDDGGVQTIPLPSSLRFLLVHSLAHHEFLDGTYNRLREDCEAAAAALGVSHLRDATVADLPRLEGKVSDERRKRAKHVVSENDRVLSITTELQRSPSEALFEAAKSLGAAMFASHSSSRNDFGNSVAELDELVRSAEEIAAKRQAQGEEGGILGCRLCGGGFGGCVIALVTADKVEEVERALASVVKAREGVEPPTFRCRVVDGAFALSL